MIALTLVFGTIMVVDLRILRLASTDRAFRQVSHDMLKLTWAFFALALATGALMFTVNARVYWENPFFRAKMVLMVLAGLNMVLFQVTAGRSSRQWDDKTAPLIGRTAAMLSLVLWLGVIGMGRAVGFSTTGAAAKEAPPPPSNVNFDDFLNGGSGAPPVPPPSSGVHQ